jgi:hypothetical protein
MKIDYDYFLKEYHGFRAILCSREYTKEQKLKAWEGLLLVYVNVRGLTKDEEAVCESAMLSMAQYELPTRLALEATGNLDKLIREAQVKFDEEKRTTLAARTNMGETPSENRADRSDSAEIERLGNLARRDHESP